MNRSPGGRPCPVTEHAAAVQLVLAWRYPLQIIRGVVGCIAVDMVHLAFIERVRDERLSDQSVNVGLFVLTSAVESDVFVPVPIVEPFQFTLGANAVHSPEA